MTIATVRAHVYCNVVPENDVEVRPRTLPGTRRLEWTQNRVLRVWLTLRPHV